MGIDRIWKTRQLLEKRELDAFLVSQPENRRYLSGFTGSEGWILISASHLFLCVDFRYIEQAKFEAPQFEIVYIKGALSDWLPPVISDTNIKNIGVEANFLSVTIYNQICEILSKENINIIPTTDLAESLRIFKDKDELQYIRKAAELADLAFEYAKSIVLPGRTEREIAWGIEKYLRENGSQALPFDVIVASGPNSALPHARPTERSIQRNEPILIDLGARTDGYCSDLSRTIVFGEYDEFFQKIYNIVLGAQLTALNTMAAEMTGEQADKLARAIVEQANYGNYFDHSLGHGVGILEHEKPRLGPKSTDILSNSMVFTVEPGIYIPGWGGIRIEDTVVMENNTITTLTKSDKKASI